MITQYLQILTITLTCTNEERSDSRSLAQRRKRRKDCRKGGGALSVAVKHRYYRYTASSATMKENALYNTCS